MTQVKDGYRQRIIDAQIDRSLKVFGAICIEGPKWCGKTWTSLNHANSSIFITSPESNFQNRTLAQLNPSLVLSGESPRLIDEWQEVPLLWDAVRYEIDQSQNKGRFILTGSATPVQKGYYHSGTGRIIRLQMRPMSLFESGDSSGQVSLEGLFTGYFTSVTNPKSDLIRLIELTVRGGWPGSLNLSTQEAAEIPKAYLQNLIEEDIRRIDESRRDNRKIQLLIRSLARNESTVASNRTLQKDIQDDDGEDINPNTITDYLDLLRRLFILDDLPAFELNIRSSVRIGKSSKRHFIDPSLAVAALRAMPERLLNDLNTFGFIFESLCLRDLKIYAESFGASIFHYRDSAGREIDAVVERADGRWGAIEIKLGANQIDQAAKDLLTLKNKILTDPKGKAPDFLCVICGLSDFAYQREDGVYVVPITALKP